MLPRTVFLSRLLGLYCIFVALAMIIHRQATVETITALANNPPAMLISGAMALAVGLAMVLAHNIWSGGAVTVVVTIVGWLSLAKGLLLLLLPPEMQPQVLLGTLHYNQYFYWYASISLVLGIYLTLGGFLPTSDSR